MNRLIRVWNWFGKNSGQLQLIVALVALFLAVLGYNKIIKQIDMADDQMRNSDLEREQVLKVSTINLLLDIIHKNNNAIQSNMKILKQLKGADLTYKSDSEIRQINDYIVLFENKNKKLLEMKDLSFQWAKNVNSNNPQESEKQLKEMTIIYDALIVINEEITTNEEILSAWIQ